MVASISFMLCAQSFGFSTAGLLVLFVMILIMSFKSGEVSILSWSEADGTVLLVHVWPERRLYFDWHA